MMSHSRLSIVSSLFLLLGLVSLTVATPKLPLQYINYTTVAGYFLQDNSTTNATTFDFKQTNFGLINRTYAADVNLTAPTTLTQWQRFEHQVLRLNLDSPSTTQYKVLFIGRHGEGVHNAAETFFGTPAWNCFFAQLSGNSTVTWLDAHLTPNGVAQAQAAHDFWANLIANQKIRTPESYYVSPLYRCLQTANITFSGLNLPISKPFVPEIKEFLREGIDIHTCDSRSNLTFIQNQFPHYAVESGFSEYDLLYRGASSETPSAQNQRSKHLLDEIFTLDQADWISFTTHSGETAAILRVLGHIPFSLSTGAVIPILVKADIIQGPAPVTTVVPYTTQNVCSEPPLSSLATGGCVCPGASTATTKPTPNYFSGFYFPTVSIAALTTTSSSTLTAITSSTKSTVTS